MKNVILSFLLCCAQVSIAQDYYCREFYLTDNGSTVTFSDTICYRSQVMIQQRGTDYLTIVTDSLTLRFVILYHQRDDKDNEKFLAAVIGQPDQIYTINRRIDNAGRFFLVCKPIKLNARFGKIQGVSLEISNVEICK